MGEKKGKREEMKRKGVKETEGKKEGKKTKKKFPKTKTKLGRKKRGGKGEEKEGQ